MYYTAIIDRENDFFLQYFFILLHNTALLERGENVKKLHSLALEQKENAKHGETFFPVQKYITHLDDAYPVVTTHWHEGGELSLIMCSI